MAGLLSSVANVVSIAFGSTPVQSGFGFFVTAELFMLLSCAMFVLLLYSVSTEKNKCYRTMLGISYCKRKTDQTIWQLVDVFAGRKELLVSSIASYHGLAMFAILTDC